MSVHTKRAVAIFSIVLFALLSAAGCATPLQSAAGRGDINEVRNLIEKGADINARNFRGMTPLHWAAFKGKTDTASLLIEKGADVNEKTNSGMTPLHLAAYKGKTNTARLLIEKGADVNAKDNIGFTPLHWTVYVGKTEPARLLIEKGADMNARNNAGETALELAQKGGQTEFAQLLQSAAAAKLASPAQQSIQAPAAAARPATAQLSQVLVETSSQPIDSDKIAKLKDSQPCKMKEPAWIYTGTKCTADVADGEGTASHENGVLTFKGQIKGGTRVKGIIYHSEIPLYDGPIVDGRPDGVGVCFHEGEPEECKFYNGKRIDAIFKQRIEFAKQREEMQQVKKDVENLKASSSTASASSNPDAFTDTLKKEAGKRLATEIFNRLF